MFKIQQKFMRPLIIVTPELVDKRRISKGKKGVLVCFAMFCNGRI